MRAYVLLVLSIVCASSLAATAQAQDSSGAPSTQSGQAQPNSHVIEGTVVSMSQHTLVVRSDDDHYHLFTYVAGVLPKGRVKPGARIRVTGSAPNAEGTEEAENVTVIVPGGPATTTVTAQAMPPSPKVNEVSKQIEGEARRWHVGGKIGSGLSPNIFMFGPQAQFGPFFSPHLIFRPNVEFGFGELTDMYAINAEAAYLFTKMHHGQWSPYAGMGPSFNFISQSASGGGVSFSNFTYKTGFNIFVGAQKNKMFVEIKTALWSAQAPVFRMFVGYNF